jgi:sigma-B regulation protein RsbU (phosphoserine phosphatase)
MDGWYLVEYSTPKLGTVLEVRAMMKYRGREGTLGAAHVGLSKKVIEDALSDARKNALIAGGASALAGILAAFILAGFLAKPIHILQKGAAAVGDGNLDVIIPITSRDELGQLAANFNDMSQKLKLAQKAQIEKEKMDQELAIANEVQQLLLPKRLPSLPGYDIAAVYKAARTVGGDYYDVIPQGNKLHLIVGDVSGKGIPGLVGMTLARNAIRYSMGNEASPQRILTQANDLVFDDLAGTMFITVFHAVLQPQTKTLVCCNAGHHQLAIYRAGSKTIQRVGGEGLAFRIARGAQFAQELKEEATILAPGDIALLYTDGANEAMDPDFKMFGEDRLEWALSRAAGQSAQGIVASITQEIEVFRRGAEPNDDLTMLAIKAL